MLKTLRGNAELSDNRLSHFTLRIALHCLYENINECSFNITFHIHSDCCRTVIIITVAVQDI